jgi:hypothetical protein
VVHRNGTTYIGKNFPHHFLEQRVSDRAGGTPRNNIQNANQEHLRLGVNFNPFINSFISPSVKFRYERFITLG